MIEKEYNVIEEMTKITDELIEVKNEYIKLLEERIIEQDNTISSLKGALDMIKILNKK